MHGLNVEVLILLIVLGPAWDKPVESACAVRLVLGGIARVVWDKVMVIGGTRRLPPYPFVWCFIYGFMRKEKVHEVDMGGLVDASS